MSVLPCSEMTYFSVLSARRLGEFGVAQIRTDELEQFIEELRSTRASVDYFATSLPTLLLFAEDLDARRATTILILEAQLAALQGDPARAGELVRGALSREPSRVRALDLQRELAGSTYAEIAS